MALTPTQALDMLKSDDLLGLGFEADAVRKRLHPEGVVTYIVDRNINYTNVCTEYCSFCAFYRPVGSPEGYIQPLESIFEKIDETLALGGTGILMQGGLHPDLKIDYYENLLSSIRQRYPFLHLHCFSAPEILNIAEVSGMNVRDTIMRLMDAGLDSIPGGGAEILDDEVRQRIARLKCTTEEWLLVHRTAHQLGMRTTATMMFGCGETLEHRINHFAARPPTARGDRRLHGLHPLALPTRKHLARQLREGGSQCRRLPENACRLPHLSGQHPQRPGLVAYPGPQDLPDRSALRRQRCG